MVELGQCGVPLRFVEWLCFSWVLSPGQTTPLYDLRLSKPGRLGNELEPFVAEIEVRERCLADPGSKI